MFCQLCGTANTDTATACASCSTPISIVRASAGSPAVADTVKATSRDAFAAFYEACRTGIEAHDVRRERIETRLRPFNN